MVRVEGVGDVGDLRWIYSQNALRQVDTPSVCPGVQSKRRDKLFNFKRSQTKILNFKFVDEVSIEEFEEIGDSLT